MLSISEGIFILYFRGKDRLEGILGNFNRVT